MGKLMRVLNHGWRDPADARRALGAGAVERLAERVRQSELAHSGEIRVCVEAGLPLSYLWRGAAARERAVTLFGKLGVWDTAHNNGVLIYLLLAERQIEIVADRGIDAQVAGGHWQALVAGMSQSFGDGRFEDGLNRAIDAVGALLGEHFALAAGVRGDNELPDAPVIV